MSHPIPSYQSLRDTLANIFGEENVYWEDKSEVLTLTMQPSKCASVQEMVEDRNYKFNYFSSRAQLILGDAPILIARSEPHLIKDQPVLSFGFDVGRRPSGGKVRFILADVLAENADQLAALYDETASHTGLDLLKLSRLDLLRCKSKEETSRIVDALNERFTPIFNDEFGANHDSLFVAAHNQVRIAPHVEELDIALITRKTGGHVFNSIVSQARSESLGLS